MAFDTKYRPHNYEDVLGQDEYIEVLLEIVRSGTGLHQSYLFCGQHGSGKTTLGRILARALLCTNNQNGAPCNECDSCISVLEGRSECFIEFDAATNSGKDDIKRLVEEQHVSTFSGQQRIYLFDESHQLSKQALDALLKPMEDEQPGSENKQLVCIFCTTEPERMRSTIFSRCAPAFTIRPNPPEVIAKRLAYVCEQEGIEYDDEALVLLSEYHESHIRDALKSTEGISKLGKVSVENANRYLRMDATLNCTKILGHLGTNLPEMLRIADELHEYISPSVAYKRLAEIAMMAYRAKLKVGRIPSYWDVELLTQIADTQGEYLLIVADHLSSRPAHPSQAMLLCDLAHLHHGRVGTLPAMAVTQINAPAVMVSAPVVESQPAPAPERSDPPAPSGDTERSVPQSDPATVNVPPTVGKVQTQNDPSPPAGGSDASPTTREAGHGDASPPPPKSTQSLDFFRMVLRARVEELARARRGSTGRPHMGSG